MVKLLKIAETKDVPLGQATALKLKAEKSPTSMWKYRIL